MIASRRRFLFGAGATLLAAPSIVRVASLMAIKPLPELQVFRVFLTSNPAGKDTWLTSLYAPDDAISWTATPGLNVGDTFTIAGIYARA